jgi:hypothetical protein
MGKILRKTKTLVGWKKIKRRIKVGKKALKRRVKKIRGKKRSGLSAWLRNGLNRVKGLVVVSILTGYLKYGISRVSNGLKDVLRIGTRKS